ncbi:Exodeoxyribonuclease 1 [Ceratocystis lukuohia]|uniref:Exodeoxyribonuclease 1 n=1 Tax=Ceratocystis lukuohia TaxID=2019550 RepID=A0ABR4MNH3_9PEZI
MGVQGLLVLLKSIQNSTTLKRYNGQTLGVDTYGWLHKAAISCASLLAQGKPTKRYVEYCMRRVRMLQHFGVTPYLVFDGDYLPSKAITEASREAKREASKKRGMELLKAGKHRQADEEFQKCIDISPEMARAVIDELKKQNISYVVAPYEADAQLVYLEKMGLIHGILSEDSDLLVFGAKKLITKLDNYGACVEISRSEFCRVRDVCLTGWSDAEFRRMCILSGCDYLASIPGIGLKSAYRLIRNHKTPERIVQMLRFDGKSKVSENYLTEFVKAELTFIHQRVFCPIKREMVMLNDDETGAADGMPFIGAWIEPETSRLIASGDLDPMTKKPLGDMPISPRKRRATSFGSETSTPTAGSPAPGAITSFFNRRIPMGEMDSNCFSVDPDQVAEITNHGLAPRVFPLPRPYIEEASTPRRSPRRRRQTEPVQNLLNQHSTPTPSPTLSQKATTPNRRSVGPSFIGFGTQPRPKKKARLCDDDVAEESEILETPVQQRSRFFPVSTPKAEGVKSMAAAAEKPPSLPPPKTVNETASEISETLPELDQWHSPQRPRRNSLFKVFDDLNKPKETDNSEAPNLTIQLTSAKSTPVSPRKAARHSICLMPPPPSPQTRETVDPTKQSVGLSHFACQLDQTANSSPKNSHTPVSSSQPSPIKAPLASTPSFVKSGTPGAASAPRMTPLQRMGVRALKTASSMPGLSRSTSLRNIKSFWETRSVSSLAHSSKSPAPSPSPSPSPTPSPSSVSSSAPVARGSTGSSLKSSRSVHDLQGSEEMLPFLDDESREDSPPFESTTFDLSRFRYS